MKRTILLSWIICLLAAVLLLGGCKPAHKPNEEGSDTDPDTKPGVESGSVTDPAEGDTPAPEIMDPDRIEREYIYDDNGELIHIDELEYQNHCLIRISRMLPDETLCNETFYGYDENRERISSYALGYIDGKLFSRAELSLEGEVLSETQYDENGNAFWSIVYEIVDGVRVSSTDSAGFVRIYHYGVDGTERGYSDYDADGNLVEEFFYDNN